MENHDQQTEPEQTETILCHNCLTENSVHANFCTKCNTQLSTYAAYDPLMQIAASGDTYIKATTGRPGWIKTLGIILIFSPVSLNGFIGLSGVSGETFGSIWGAFFAIGHLAQIFIGLYVILKVLIRNFLPAKSAKTG